MTTLSAKRLVGEIGTHFAIECRDSEYECSIGGYTSGRLRDATDDCVSVSPSRREGSSGASGIMIAMRWDGVGRR